MSKELLTYFLTLSSIFDYSQIIFYLLITDIGLWMPCFENGVNETELCSEIGWDYSSEIWKIVYVSVFV